ncbi:hypothetical protein K661_00432 [Piscirickettsia salmonis LF-89 = ATCC VR-1361]|nr:hypothetical protein K661_00432 [Piscirickettsia salmonis LF-89 = ATCC VR-1361]
MSTGEWAFEVLERLRINRVLYSRFAQFTLAGWLHVVIA